jgi:SHS2 domain-containing protein
MEPQQFKVIEHTADTGFEVRGRTRAKAYEAAALALFQTMWEINKEKHVEPVNLKINGGDPPELLVNFLEEFLYLYEAKELVCTKVRVDSVTEDKISARAWLQNFTRDKDQELLGVKAITYHQLFIGKQDDEWVVRVFLDI